MSLIKNRPKDSPTIFLSKLTHNLSREQKISQRLALLFASKLPKYVNSRPIGENSPNLVTLSCSLLKNVTGKLERVD
jgi:hypothetical protein